ncbi:hypothetical protein KUTeg_022630 [Tegillarca granosa]|uniref:Uncharacterized protein n=1 Tax=Tegillarca granosa TaxID=220873 RepID=A0ABQ9E4Z8_TEGGR|nr:hypothetical protein KUTeg_022630 [Tegillarca granosa]
MNLLQTITFTLFSGVLNGSLIPNLFPSKTLLLNDYSHVDTTHSKEPSCDYKQLISGLGLPESEIDTIKYNKYAVPRATMREVHLVLTVDVKRKIIILHGYWWKILH